MDGNQVRSQTCSPCGVVAYLKLVQLPFIGVFSYRCDRNLYFCKPDIIGTIHRNTIWVAIRCGGRDFMKSLRIRIKRAYLIRIVLGKPYLSIGSMVIPRAQAWRWNSPFGNGQSDRIIHTDRISYWHGKPYIAIFIDSDKYRLTITCRK